MKNLVRAQTRQGNLDELKSPKAESNMFEHMQNDRDMSNVMIGDIPWSVL